MESQKNAVGHDCNLQELLDKMVGRSFLATLAEQSSEERARLYQYNHPEFNGRKE